MPHLDAAFDRGFITVEDVGAVTVSRQLAPQDRRVLGLSGELNVTALADRHRTFLPWHRSTVFRW